MRCSDQWSHRERKIQREGKSMKSKGEENCLLLHDKYTGDNTLGNITSKQENSVDPLETKRV